MYRADKRVSRYKTLDEQRAERRSYFSEKEIAIDAPTAPPRFVLFKSAKDKDTRQETEGN